MDRVSRAGSSLSRELRGAACGWPSTRLASTHLLPPSRVLHCPHPPWLVKHRKIPGTVPGVPSLLCPLRSRGVRVASPPAAALHNRGDDACPAAARGVTLHVAGAQARSWALCAHFQAVTPAHRAAGLLGIPLLTRNLGGAVGGLFRIGGKRRKNEGKTKQKSSPITVKSPHLCSTHSWNPLPSIRRRAGGWRQWRYQTQILTLNRSQ